jgi:hypothetical protein
LIPYNIDSNKNICNLFQNKKKPAATVRITESSDDDSSEESSDEEVSFDFSPLSMYSLSIE